MLARLDGPARADGLTWPDPDSKTRLVIAPAATPSCGPSCAGWSAGTPRRRAAAPPTCAGDRTVPDLPPVGVLPLDPDRGGTARGTWSPSSACPATRPAVAAAVLDGDVRRLDLLRNDGGSVTLDGALLGGVDEAGRPLHWRGRVEVDDAVLADGDEPVLACAVANAGGYARSTTCRC